MQICMTILCWTTARPEPSAFPKPFSSSSHPPYSASYALARTQALCLPIRALASHAAVQGYFRCGRKGMP
jgi:hypothetical protein